MNSKKTQFDVDFELYLLERFGIKCKYDLIEVIKHEFLSDMFDLENEVIEVPAIGEQAIINKLVKIRVENLAMIKYYNSAECQNLINN